MKKKSSDFMRRIRNCDRTILICLCTGAAFALMGLFQLILILLTPKSQTFDHYLLVITDFIIAAGCFGYSIYRNRNLPGISSENTPDQADNMTAPQGDIPTSESDRAGKTVRTRESDSRNVPSDPVRQQGQSPRRGPDSPKRTTDSGFQSDRRRSAEPRSQYDRRRSSAQRRNPYGDSRSASRNGGSAAESPNSPSHRRKFNSRHFTDEE